ncbi:hypothetical protein ACFVS2_34050 [Brevibacillus sp. NPDC058079]|uniref:hypothetical protein n=1 Tax=Brevibacillus sp. NPDC058079 TaxID=3346330 RepID=UPI0036EFD4C8
MVATKSDETGESKNLTIKQAPLVVTGGFRSEEGMNEAIESGAVDMVGVGKLFALNPDFPNQIILGNYRTVTITCSRK